MTRSRYRVYEDHTPCFLTCTVMAWLPVFTRPETVNIVLDSWRFLQAQERLCLYGYVILENHLHLIADSPNLSKEIGDFKSFTARRIIDYLREQHASLLLDLLAYYKARHKDDQQYQFWQEGSHPQKIKDEEMMRQTLEYMHNNPVDRGYVDELIHWRYSSARNYLGVPGLLEVRTAW
jgi:REP element-mobilizing transposase RayT